MMQGIHHPAARPHAQGVHSASQAVQQNPQQGNQTSQSQGVHATPQPSQTHTDQLTQQANHAQAGASASFHPSQELANGVQARAVHQESQLAPSYLALAYTSSENSAKAMSAAIAVQELMHCFLELEVHESEPLDRPIDEAEEYATWESEDEPPAEEDYEDEDSLFDYREG